LSSTQLFTSVTATLGALFTCPLKSHGRLDMLRRSLLQAVFAVIVRETSRQLVRRHTGLSRFAAGRYRRFRLDPIVRLRPLCACIERARTQSA